jgi:hypothetical protein
MPARAVDAAKTIQLNLSLIRHRRIPRWPRMQEVIDELGFGRVVLATVQPYIQPRRLGRIVIRGHT